MEEFLDPYLNTIALVLLLTIVVAVVYLIIYIHDIPYEIAKKRNHPHQDAFHVAGWVSLFLMHTIWPLLWIWAYWYKPDTVAGTVIVKSENDAKKDEQIKSLENQISELKAALANTNQDKPTNN